MPTTLLRPNADSKADWTETPAGTAFSKLDEVVTQPTAPTDVSGDNINVAAAATCRVDMETFTLPANEAVAQVKGWGYMATGTTRPCHIAVIGPGGLGTMADTTVPQATASSWQSATFTGSITQSDINALQLQWLSSSGTGTCTVYAGYLEVVTKWVITTGIASTTNTANASTVRKIRTTGIATTTNTANGSTARKSVTTGIATTTNTANASTVRKIRTTGIATETDAGRSTHITGIAGETDAGSPSTASKRYATGRAVETDQAFVGGSSLAESSAQTVTLGDRRLATISQAGRHAGFARAAVRADFAQPQPTAAQITGSKPEPDTTTLDQAEHRTASFTTTGSRRAAILSER